MGIHRQRCFYPLRNIVRFKHGTNWFGGWLYLLENKALIFRVVVCYHTVSGNGTFLIMESIGNDRLF